MKVIDLDTLAYRAKLVRASDEHKGNAGKVLLIGGDAGMAGAILLAARACLHAGAGWTVVSILDQASAEVMTEQPELMVRLATLGDCAQVNPDVIAIGPGLGTSSRAISLVSEALHSDATLVMDADAINALTIETDLLELLRNRKTAKTILTPHPGEAARLLGISVTEVQTDRLAAYAALVQQTNAIIVLKGEGTLVGESLELVKVCRAGNPGMGTGGMGDVLTGAMAAVLAQAKRHNLTVEDAVGLAVELHATAGDRLVTRGIGPIGLTPSELLLEIRNLINIK